MCYGNRTPGLQLPLEEGNDRTVGTQYISKARRHHLHRLLKAGSIGHSLGYDLGHAFGGTHHVSRVDGFVRAHHHKSGHPVFTGQVKEGRSSQNIDAHRLHGVFFHQGHMLVGRGMKNHLRTMFANDLAHALGIGDIGHIIMQRSLTGIQAPFCQVELQIVKRSLGLVHQDQLSRVVVHELLNQFRPDGTGRAGHHHHLFANQATDLGIAQVDRIPLQKFLNGHRGDLTEGQFPVDPMFQRRNYFDLNIPTQAQIHDGLLAPRFDVLNANNEFINATVFQKFRTQCGR